MVMSFFRPLTNVSHRPKYLACAFFPPYVMENINGRYMVGFSSLLKTLDLPLNKNCNTCSKAMVESYDEKHIIFLIYLF